MIRVLLIVFCYLRVAKCMCQPVQLYYSGHDKNIDTAVIIVNQLLNSAEFQLKVNEVFFFDNSSYSSKQIISEMINCDTVKVSDYMNPFGKINTKSLDSINMNLVKIPRDLPLLINLLVHETIHVVDWRTNKRWDYNHRNQKNEDPPISAPCVFARIAELMALEMLNSQK